MGLRGILRFSSKEARLEGVRALSSSSGKGERGPRTFKSLADLVFAPRGLNQLGVGRLSVPREHCGCPFRSTFFVRRRSLQPSELEDPPATQSSSL